MKRLLTHFRDQWMGMLALFLALSGGTAYALDGSNTVFTDDITDGEVRTQDLRGASVVNSKLADGSVTSQKIAQGAVTSGDIAQGAVTSDDVFDRGIGGIDLAEGAVGTFQLRNGGVEEPDIADGAVNSAKIGNGTITSADIDESQVSGLDRCSDTQDSIRGLCMAPVSVDLRSWVEASDFCTSQGMRVASVGELRGILRQLDFNPASQFWANDLGESEDDLFGAQTAYVVGGDGSIRNTTWSAEIQTVCVTEPNN